MSKIIVKSARDSFRRAGLAFTREGTTLDTKDLSKDQLKAIREEPALSVQDVQEKETAAEKKAREEAEAKAKAEAEKTGNK